MKIDDRDGQQSESVTTYCVNVVPSVSIRTTCGMYWTRFQERSSVRINTTFGRVVFGIGVVGVVRVVGVVGVADGWLDPRQAAADAAMIRIRTAARHR